MNFAPAHVHHRTPRLAWSTARDYRSAAEMVASYTMIRNHFWAIPERVETTSAPRMEAPPPCIEPAPPCIEPAPPEPPHMGVLVEDIIRAICGEFQITKVELLSAGRKLNVVRPRQMAFALCKHLTTRSLPEIGRRFVRDHTTVLHGIRKLASILDATKDGMPHDATAAQWVRVMREYMDPQ
jgi:hypothetical protein